MAEAFKCDNCGRLREGEPDGTLSYGQMPNEEFGGELCAICAEVLRDWWQKTNNE